MQQRHVGIRMTLQNQTLVQMKKMMMKVQKIKRRKKQRCVSDCTVEFLL